MYVGADSVFQLLLFQYYTDLSDVRNIHLREESLGPDGILSFPAILFRCAEYSSLNRELPYSLFSASKAVFSDSCAGIFFDHADSKIVKHC